MTMSFDLHNSLSKNTQSLLYKAVTFDEQKKYSLALPAYETAISSLISYLRTFSSTSTTFINLSNDEKPLVSARVNKFSSFLQNARERQQAISTTSSSSSTPPAMPTRAFKSITLTPSRDTFKSTRNLNASMLPINNSNHDLTTTKIPVVRNNNNNNNPNLTLARPPLPLSRHQQQSIPDRAVALRSTAKSLPPATVKPEDPLREAIESEILDSSPNVQWDDIYGLGDVRDALTEMIVLPVQRPDLYSGLRAPGKGILLFGPPGVGKSLIAKAVATNMNATFFSISASSLNSKYHGESERLVRTLFQVARERQPAFIFLDEVDSVLGARRADGEHEASRRLKTEFMCQFDGAGSSSGGNSSSRSHDSKSNQGDRVYVMAASNRPQDLDDAVRRRLDRRIYVPLPDEEGRISFLQKLTSKDDGVQWKLSQADFKTLGKRTVRYSGSDLKALCREASLMPLRELGEKVSEIRVEDVRACDMRDFDRAFQVVRPSANEQLIKELQQWNEKFGSKSMFKKPPSTQKNGRSNGGGGGNEGSPSSSKLPWTSTTATKHANTGATSPDHRRRNGKNGSASGVKANVDGNTGKKGLTSTVAEWIGVGNTRGQSTRPSTRPTTVRPSRQHDYDDNDDNDDDPDWHP